MRNFICAFLLVSSAVYAGPAIRYAVIDSNSTIQNIVMWDGASNWSPPIGMTVMPVPATGYQPTLGDSYSGGAFVQVTPPVAVPSSITAAQIRLALNAQGLLTTVNSAVAASSLEIQTYWQYSATFERQNTILLTTAAALGLTSAQVDAIFIAAAVY